MSSGSGSGSDSGSGSGSGSSAAGGAEGRVAKLRKLKDDLNITIATVKELRSLERYDIVILADDSGSMSDPVKPGPSQDLSHSIDISASADGEDDAFAVHRTRWSECENVAHRLLQLGTSLDTDGVDIYFLNRDGKKGVTSAGEVKKLFTKTPAGGTPLTAALEKIRTDFQAKAAAESDKKLLVVIITDGLPTGGALGGGKGKASKASKGKASKASKVSKASKSSKKGKGSAAAARVPVAQENLKTMMTMEKKMGGSAAAAFRQKVMDMVNEGASFSFLLCTDSELVANYYLLFDGLIPNIDVTDDYATEAMEVAAKGGTLTRGDYVVKGLLGATDPKWDTRDGQ